MRHRRAGGGASVSDALAKRDSVGGGEAASRCAGRPATPGGESPGEAVARRPDDDAAAVGAVAVTLTLDARRYRARRGASAPTRQSQF